MSENSFRLPRIEGDFIGSPTSGALALLRFPLALLVISEHWFEFRPALDRAGLEGDAGAFPVWDAICEFVRSFLADNGVATFFFISGFLFISCVELTKERYRRNLRRRVRTLLVPYVVWTLVMVISVTAESVVHQLAGNPGAPLRFPIGVGDFFKGLVLGTFPLYQPLWFIRELATAILLLAVTYPLLRLSGKWTLAAIAAAGIFVSITDFGLFPGLERDTVHYLRNLCIALLLFNAGAWLSMRRCDLVGLFSRSVRGWFAIYLLFGCAAWFSDRICPGAFYVVKFVSIPPAVATLLGLSGVLVRKGVTANQFLTASTFFLFAAHYLLVHYMRVALAKAFAPENDAELSLVFSAGYILLVGFIIAVYALLQRYAPRAVSLLSGGRNPVRKS